MKILKNMMKKSISAAICGAICLTCSAGVLLQPANCYAEVVEGFAPIVNGDVETARQKARKYAMRSYVESKVGVNVESNTTVDMGLVISDRIVTDSKGYVQIKKVISEKQQGSLYVVKLDLEADDTVIETKYKEDAAKAMGALDVNTDSRRAANIAIIHVGLDGRNVKDEQATFSMRKYMEAMNVQTVQNDELMNYMLKMPDATLADLRKEAIATNYDNDAGSILTGRIKDISVNKVEGGYVAEVEAYYLFAGLRNNYSNSYSEYFQEFGRTSHDALRTAHATAANKASEELTKSALKVIQIEDKFSASLEFHNLTDKINQGNAIVSVLQNMGCRILKEGFAPNGVYKIRMVTTNYITPGEFTTAFKTKAAASGLNFGTLDVSGSGSTAIAFTL